MILYHLMIYDTIIFYLQIHFLPVKAGSGGRIWWQLRVKLDAYLDIAEAEVKSFQKSLEELASYNECKSVFSSLMSTYTKSNLDADKMP